MFKNTLYVETDAKLQTDTCNGTEDAQLDHEMNCITIFPGSCNDCFEGNKWMQEIKKLTIYLITY